MSEVVLSVENLSVAYETRGGLVTAVSDFDITVSSGELVAIVGQSGSGKSTVSSTINRLNADNAKITGGEILFDGESVLSMSEARMNRIRGKDIGLVPQDPMSNLDPVQRIGTQIVEALRVNRTIGRSEARARAIKLLELVGIADPVRRFQQYPHEFSGGMRQRVLIAIGMALGPKLLIADEPTSALDVTVQKSILDTLTRVAKSEGSAILLVTHDLALAAERCDRVVVMLDGKKVEEGTSGEVFTNPKSEYAQRLLLAQPSFDRQKRKLVAKATAGDEPADPLVEFADVTKTYVSAGFPRKKFEALHGITLSIDRGSTVSLVGESGSGKSTVAKIALGLEEATTGTVSMSGTPIASLLRNDEKSYRRKIQPVFQNPFGSLDPRFTVGDSVAEPLVIHREGMYRGRGARVQELLDKVSLPTGVADRYPHELSGGQRQRVAIARALALNPEIVVLDEAVSALDVIVQAQILDLLRELQDELDLSYLFISHDLAVVSEISDKVHVMRSGEIIESGSPATIFDSPSHRYTRELIAAIPGRNGIPEPEQRRE